jgi:hypothetical protein
VRYTHRVLFLVLELSVRSGGISRSPAAGVKRRCSYLAVDALGQEIGVAAVPRVLCDLRHQGSEVAHVSLWSTDDPGVVAA